MRRRHKILPALAVLALLAGTEEKTGEEYVGGWIALASGEQRGELGIRDGTSNTSSGSGLNAGSLRALGPGVSSVEFPTSG